MDDLLVLPITYQGKDYGKERADVIMNSVGNIIAGQSTADTAKNISARIGRIMQDRESLSIKQSDTSIGRSKQLEAAVPASRIPYGVPVNLQALWRITRIVRLT